MKVHAVALWPYLESCFRSRLLAFVAGYGTRSVGWRWTVFSLLGCLHDAHPGIALLGSVQLEDLTGLALPDPLRLRAAMPMAAGHGVNGVLVPCDESTVTCLSKGHMTRGCISCFGADNTQSGCFDNKALKGERILAGYAAALAWGACEEERLIEAYLPLCASEFGRSGRWGKREILRTCKRALVREWNVS